MRRIKTSTVSALLPLSKLHARSFAFRQILYLFKRVDNLCINTLHSTLVLMPTAHRLYGGEVVYIALVNAF